MERKPARVKLKLRRESLKSLTKEELSKVPGGASKVIGGKYYPCQPNTNGG